jgi:hypothetical protein
VCVKVYMLGFPHVHEGFAVHTLVLTASEILS